MIGQKKIFEHQASALHKGSYYLLQLTNEISYPKETLEGFKELVNESEDLYPGIDLWFSNKVIPGIKEGIRYAYLVMHEGKPVAEAIVKKGADVKLCSMRIKPAYQRKAIGPILFAHIAKMISQTSELIHFTAPESLVVERNGLFNRLGFVNVGKSKRTYRPGEDEFVFRADCHNFKHRANRLLSLSKEEQSNINFQSNSIVLSVWPKYAHQILTYKKTIELRKRFSKNLVGATVFLYATRPTQAVVGEAIISAIVEGKPKEIWSIFKEKLGCSHQEYWNYCVGSKKITAILLEEISPYPDPLPWSVFSTAFNAPIRPPQSYQFLKPSGFSHSSQYRINLPDPETKDGEQISLFEYA